MFGSGVAPPPSPPLQSSTSPKMATTKPVEPPKAPLTVKNYAKLLNAQLQNRLKLIAIADIDNIDGDVVLDVLQQLTYLLVVNSADQIKQQVHLSILLMF